MQIARIMKSIILTILLAIFFGTQLFSQTIFSPKRQDWLAHQLVQLNALRTDSALQAHNLHECDSAKTVMEDKFDAMKFKYQEAAIVGEQCQTKYNALNTKYNKSLANNSKCKNALLITISTTILEGIALWYVMRK